MASGSRFLVTLRPDDPAGGPPDHPIDTAHLRRQTLGDRDLETELLDLFARQAGAIMTDVAATPGVTAVARRRRADLFHTLCGSARTIGAWEVADGAAQLEEEERACGPAEACAGQAATAALEALDRSVASARSAIRRMREDGGSHR